MAEYLGGTEENFVQMMNDKAKELGMNEDISFVGWTFNRDFALNNKDLINSFLNATLQSKKILNFDDQEWNRIKKDMKVEDDATFEALKNGYRKGIIKDFSQKEIDNLSKVFKILSQDNDTKIVGAKTLDENTFWKYDSKIDW